jgi:hypothetical protein
MFGPEYVDRLNRAGALRDWIEADPDECERLYEADEVATELAYVAGWYMEDNGEWRTDEDWHADAPLDEAMRGDWDPALMDALLERLGIEVE